MRQLFYFKNDSGWRLRVHSEIYFYTLTVSFSRDFVKRDVFFFFFGIFRLPTLKIRFNVIPYYTAISIDSKRKRNMKKDYL